MVRTVARCKRAAVVLDLYNTSNVFERFDKVLEIMQRSPFIRIGLKI